MRKKLFKNCFLSSLRNIDFLFWKGAQGSFSFSGLVPSKWWSRTIQTRHLKAERGQLSLRAEPEANKDFSRPFPLLCQNCQFYSQPKICLLAPFLSVVCLCWLNCSGSCVSGWASLGWVACVRPVPEGQVHGPFYHTEEPHTMVRCCCVSVSPHVGFACSLKAWLFALVWHPSSVKGEQGREGRLSLGTDKRNVHIPTCRRVILAYPWVNLNLMLTKTALLWPIIPTGYVCFKY